MWEQVGQAVRLPLSSDPNDAKTAAAAAALLTTDEYLLFPVDNASHRCPAAYEYYDKHCSNDNTSSSVLLLTVMRWSKLVALKLARSYYAMPILLVALPLATGLAFGFWWGRRYSEQAEQKHSRNNSNGASSSSSWSYTEYCVSALSSLLFMMLMRQDDTTELTNKPTLRPSLESITPTPKTEPKTNKQTEPLESQTFPETKKQLEAREETVRAELRSDEETRQESGVPASSVPKHVAVIMDGNRRYGKRVYNSASAGHWDGSRKVLDFAKWCIAEKISVLTVYAFSTENWRRDPAEVASLMSLFVQYCQELRVEALRRNIRVRVLSTEEAQIPTAVKVGLRRLEKDTAQCVGGLLMNICLSYGSRGEIVNACRDLAQDCADGKLKANQITEQAFDQRLLTAGCGDVDVLIRTSGEIRISNYLLWQLAYSEMFFLDKNWPELEKDDLLEVIRSFAKGRDRRFGK